MAILLIEDDLQAAQLMRQSLSQHGYVVEHVADGELGLKRALEQPWDLLIADRMLPKLEGLAIVKQVRERGIQMPILILSALAEVDDRVRGLRAGGDDYLTKPYAFAELLARIEGLLRRGKQVDARIAADNAGIRSAGFPTATCQSGGDAQDAAGTGVGSAF